MLIKYLAKSPKINQVVHFDAPIGIFDLLALINLSKDRKTNQSNLIFFQTLSRILGLKNSGRVKYYTFVKVSRLTRLFSPRSNAYMDFITRVLSRNKVGQRRTIFFVCPKNFDFPEIVKTFEPQFVVCDVIDDHRAWYDKDDPYVERLTQNYRDIIRLSDLVIVNCEKLRESMLNFADEVCLIPNACEIPIDEEFKCKKPEEFKKIKGHIIGYVGNLSSRIDIDLLKYVVTNRPDWNLILIGSAHLSKDIVKLTAYDNVYFLGVKPYHKVRKYISSFDVAIIPHLKNKLTRSMNPLKLFVYCSMNVPVVSTEIDGIDELREAIYVARDKKDFIEKIEVALKTGRTGSFGKEYRDLLRKNSWPCRVDRILSLVEKHWPNGRL